MECQVCRSKDLTILGRWTRQCQKCGHQWTVTRHTERHPKQTATRKDQP